MQSGKRQRRQAAALVVQSLWSSNSKKKPAGTIDSTTASTTNRPAMEVPPMGFGPIRTPNCNDVLCGRGGLINGSPGNVQFRTIVSKRKKEYNAKSCKRADKAHMAAEIVRQIRSMDPPGRFLREDANGMWFDVGDARAIRKTGQALREAAPAIRGDDDRASSESGSDNGQKESAESVAPEEKKKKGSPKRKKNELVASSDSKDIKSEKDAASEKPSQAEAQAMEEGPPQGSSTSKQSGKRNWLPTMNMLRSKNTQSNKDNSDTASVSADTVRSSQSYLIPAPHSANAPVAALPRMSPGAVFSNSHSSRHRTPEHPPHPYPPQHHVPYPYPYAHYMPPMYPAMPHHHPYPPHHHFPYPQSAVPAPMVPTRGTLPSEDAFGMNFFPTRDVNMEQSDNGSSCTVSDISGLSSAMTSSDNQRKQPPPYIPPRKAQKPQPDDGGEKLLAPPPTSSGGCQSSSMEEVSMLDTTSSLPSFSDIMDDVDMASATSESAGMVVTSSLSVAKMMAPPPPQTPVMKRGGSSIRGDINMKENSTGSCLSGKSGSCLSGKSEISLPSSCGTAISQFSDSFMALHLSDHNEFE